MANVADEISIVVIGDDPLWAKNILHNISNPLYVYWKSPSHAVDWCFAVTACDSVILTSSGSTNGWWIGYMIWPKPVFYRKRSYKCDMSEFDERHVYAADYYPDQWIPLEDEEICKDDQAPYVSTCNCPLRNISGH